MARNKISLIAAVRNEEGSIARLLDSVFNQELLPDEIVITDGGSTDRTIELVSSYANKGRPIKIIELPHAYPGKGRNAAIEAAENEIIAITDAGIELDRRWLKELSDVFENNPGADVAYGAFEPRRDTLFKRYSSIAFVGPKKNIAGNFIRTFFIASMLLKKRVWREIGGFPDLRSAEDRIFMEEIKKRGYNTVFAPGAVAVWDIPNGPKELFRRFYLYSYHGIIARRMRDWHIPVIKIYLLFLCLFFLGMFLSKAFFYAPLILLAIRALKLIKSRSEGEAVRILNPVQFAVVFFSMVLIDIAMFCGVVRYLVSKKRNKI